MGRAIWITALASLASPTWAGEDWPQFRGPTGDSISLAKVLPLTWSESRNITWQVPIFGSGPSSVVILGDRIWLTAAIEKDLGQVEFGPEDVYVADHVSLGAVCLDRSDGKRLGQVTLIEVDVPSRVRSATPNSQVLPQEDWAWNSTDPWAGASPACFPYPACPGGRRLSSLLVSWRSAGTPGPPRWSG